MLWQSSNVNYCYEGGYEYVRYETVPRQPVEYPQHEGAFLAKDAALSRALAPYRPEKGVWLLA